MNRRASIQSSSHSTVITATASSPSSLAAREISIPSRGRVLHGVLQPGFAQKGVIVLVHGSGTTCHDESQLRVAQHLGRSGFATVSVDLLDGYECGDRHNVFDAELQAERLGDVAGWLDAARDTAHLPIGYFATGVGAAIVLLAAAKGVARASAIVVRNGRPDVALYWLPRIMTPTLFIVDAADFAVRRLAATACSRLPGENAVATLENGGSAAVGETNRHTTKWFQQYLVDRETRGRVAQQVGDATEAALH